MPLLIQKKGCKASHHNQTSVSFAIKSPVIAVLAMLISRSKLTETDVTVLVHVLCCLKEYCATVQMEQHEGGV